MPEVKRSPEKKPEKKEVLYDAPRVGTVKDEKTGKYKYPAK